MCLSVRAFIYNSKKMLLNQRLTFDDKLEESGKLKFFVSCISGTTTNSAQNVSTSARPCISYFLVFNKNATNEDEIFSIFHDNNFDPELKKIGKSSSTLNVIQSDTKIDVMEELKKVVKV